MIKNIEAMIEKYGLCRKNRSERNTWRRAIIANILMVNYGWSSVKVGKLLKRDHSTVLNSQRLHENMMQYEDFKNFRKEIMRELNEHTLEDRIRACESYYDFLELQASLD